MVIAKAGYLIPAPFRAVIDERVSEAGGEVQAVADQLDVNEARVRRIGVATAGQTGLLKVQTADEWLTRLGSSVAEVYGPLYGLAIPETDGCGEKCRTCGVPLCEPAPLCGFCVEEGQGS